MSKLSISGIGLSVVIPTLGGEVLRGTIEQLNRGTLVPKEILVCIPREEAARVDELSYSNTRILVTDCRGQVAQRAAGFREVQEELVLQLDDDIFVHEDTLAVLARTLLRFGPGNVVAPTLVDIETGICTHRIDGGIIGFIKSLCYFCFAGAPWGIRRMGRITNAGLGFGVDISHCTSEPFETQWLPGGCSLGYKKDLVTDAFFPFPGKAYCEDFMHSFLRSQRGIRMWVIPTARCGIEVIAPPPDKKALSAEMRARRYFVCLTEGSLWRLALYEVFCKAKSHIRRLRQSNDAV